MSDLQKEFQTLIQKQQELRKEFQASAQKIFKGVTQEFFDKNPGITAVIWTQYCDYFNDGEPCTFAVHEPVFTNAPLDELTEVNVYGEYEGELEGVWVADYLPYVMDDSRGHYEAERNLIKNGPPIDLTSCEFFRSMIQSNEMEDIMQAMFGDHVKVTATKNGFNMDDYSDHN